MIPEISKVRHVRRVKEYRVKYRTDCIESYRASVRLYEKVNKMMQLMQVKSQIEAECERLKKEIFDLRIDHSEMIDKVLVSRDNYDLIQNSAFEHYEKNKHKYKDKKIPAKDFPDSRIIV